MGSTTPSPDSWNPGAEAYSQPCKADAEICTAIIDIPVRAWTAALDSGGQVRDGAWIAEITGMLDLSARPKGMRLIVRKGRPHPGAQLRFTDIDGHRALAGGRENRPPMGCRRPADAS
jgi:hypothetical protein